MISRPSRRSDSTSEKGRHDPRARGTPHAASQRLQPVQQVVDVLAVRTRVERHDDGLLESPHTRATEHSLAAVLRKPSEDGASTGRAQRSDP
jgi:hypothetical protein